MKWIRCIGLACLGLLLSAPGYACSPFYPYGDPRIHTALSTVVFEGVAVGTPLDDARSLLAWAELGEDGRRELRSQSYFRVTRIWKGEPGHIALVRHDDPYVAAGENSPLRMDIEMGLGLRNWPDLMYANSCGHLSFVKGERYLVFARNDGQGGLRALVAWSGDAESAHSGLGLEDRYVDVFQRMHERGSLPLPRTPGPALPRE